MSNYSRSGLSDIIFKTNEAALLSDGYKYGTVIRNHTIMV